MRRKLARETLIDFAGSIDIPGKPINPADEESEEFSVIETPVRAKHHLLILQKYQDLFEGRIRRLMIYAPPGSAKSTYGSVVFPGWCLGKVPGFRFILSSYASDIAKKQGRKTRAIARSNKFKGIFGTELSSESKAADEWSLTNGSEYMSNGILAGITGNRANIMGIDDPVKGRDEANSPTIREKTYEAYQDDLLTRLLPYGGLFLIQTRWHWEDLGGMILPENWNGESGQILCRDGMVWEVVCIPALIEDEDFARKDPLGRKVGEFLWPEWFPADHWTPYIANARTWSSLYQQRPLPETGDYFKKEWFRWYANQPARDTIRTYGVGDLAVTDGDGDWTVLLIWGIDVYDNLYLLDYYREQADSLAWGYQILSMHRDWSPFEWVFEAGQIEKGVGPFLNKFLHENKVYTVFDTVPCTGDKPSRCQSFRGRLAQGKVYFPGKPWAHEMMRRLLRLWGSSIDDEGDACSLIGLKLDRLLSGKHPKQPEKPKPSSMTFDELLKLTDPKKDERSIYRL